VNRRTVNRFYGFTLENPGRGALAQLDPYLEHGRFLSADRSYDYVENLHRVTTPLLMIAGDADVMSDMPSTEATYERVSSTDKTLLRFGRSHGHIDDYGHCDLVWSRYAAFEIFPKIIDWLDERQPRPHPTPQSLRYQMITSDLELIGTPSPQSPARPIDSGWTSADPPSLP
jgi:pimeloyl-ACP methyl ester carboxylesterase